MTHRPSLPSMPSTRAGEALIIATGRSENEPVMFCPDCAEALPKSSQAHETVSLTPGEDVSVSCPHCESGFVARAELRFSTRRPGLARKPRGER